MISLLLPTRQRPLMLAEMADSAYSTARRRPEVVVYIDDDDHESVKAAEAIHAKVLVGPRLRRMTIYWNLCFEHCSGDIVMLANDDMLFRTPDWDVMVEEEFARYPDHVLMVYGSDAGMHYGNFGPHPFVHRAWVEALGYFTPPHFVSDYGDTWINELAEKLGRSRYLPFVVEHMHFLMNKAGKDQTTLDRLARHAESDPESTWWSTLPERNAAVAKLRALMTGAGNGG